MRLKTVFAAALTAMAVAGAGIAYAEAQAANECCCCEDRADCECCDHGERHGEEQH
ncbi:MAG TPA: hypothetical protein VEA80_18850 [Vitreimonas sp.]|uniref:hypothetical protein n=1 Tax=Vitreimonas sp. TaxID=3069702 RepID=UPI002D699D09|nr:hypothetical protein [Vitreimonas sp.]HYD89546.1 hypothetical protein [Vitreimonas sp.]